MRPDRGVSPVGGCPNRQLLIGVKVLEEFCCHKLLGAGKWLSPGSTWYAGARPFGDYVQAGATHNTVRTGWIAIWITCLTLF